MEAACSVGFFAVSFSLALEGSFCNGRLTLADPLTVSAFGVGWLLARILYTFGYTRKDATRGEGRRIGSVFYVAELGLVVTAGLTAYQLLFG